MFDKILDNFKKILGENGVSQISPKKYLLSTNLMLLENFDSLPVYLVNMDDTAFLADYGKTMESLSLDFDDLPKKQRDMIACQTENLGVDFDGDSLTVTVEEGKEKLALTRFVMAINFLQTINL